MSETPPSTRADTMSHPLGRRQFLVSGAVMLGVVALSGSVSGCTSGGGAATTKLALSLPAATGPYSVGVTNLHLIDTARADPWKRSISRELSVNVFYPADPGGKAARAPWLPTAAGAAFLDHLVPDSPPPSAQAPPSKPAGGPGPGGVPPGPPPAGGSSSPGAGGPTIMPRPEGSDPVPRTVHLENVTLPTAVAYAGVPADVRATYPVLLHSPGFGDIAALATGHASALASFGYIVVTIDHTYEAAVVEFPTGRVVTAVDASRLRDLSQVLEVRVADTRFVLDQLEALRSGTNPDADQRPLPGGLARALNLAAVGMFGHSLGGATAANAMAGDGRVRAGVDLDGSIVPSVAESTSAKLAAALAGRPFMLMTSEGHGPDGGDTTLKDFWSGLTGPRRHLGITGSGHHSFTDRQVLLPQLVTGGAVSDADALATIAASVGSVDPGRSVSAQHAYLRAFFDLHLGNHDDGLLAGPSTKYPEVAFLG